MERLLPAALFMLGASSVAFANTFATADTTNRDASIDGAEYAKLRQK